MGVGSSDAEVVEVSGAAEGEFAELVDLVVADPVVRVCAGLVRGCFDGGVVGLAGCF